MALLAPDYRRTEQDTLTRRNKEARWGEPGLGEPSNGVGRRVAIHKAHKAVGKDLETLCYTKSR